MSRALDMGDDFNTLVEVYCTARVGNETVSARVTVLRGVWRDRQAREAIETQVRHALMDQILKKWTPKVYVRQ